MKVIIAGGGRAGLSVAIHLAAAGHGITLIDSDPLVTKAAFETFGLVALQGDATSTRVLREAEMAHADVVVAMLPRDADNLAVASLARAAGARRIMVRVKDEQYRAIYVAAGVHRILSETDVVIGALATAIEHDGVRTSMWVGNGDAAVFELELPNDSVFAGATVSTVANADGFPASCVFAGLYDEAGRVVAPRGASVIAASMTLLLVARRDELGAVIDFFMQRTSQE